MKLTPIRHFALCLSVAFSVQGCSKKSSKALSDAADLVDGDDPYTAPAGTEATQFLATAGGVVPTDATALAAALALASQDSAAGATLLDDNSGDADSADNATITLLNQGAGAKEGLDASTFKLPSASSLAPSSAAVASLELGLDDASPDTSGATAIAYDPTAVDLSKDTVDLTAATWGSATQIMIGRVGQIPVRNQGQRGTCAAHAGTGYLDYLAIKKFGSKFSTIDFSPERFYMMSKKALWTTGGTPGTDGGSNWGQGFDESFGLDGTTAPSASVAYNVPLESDCPYNPTDAANELQIPMAAGCLRGTARVTSVSETFWVTQNGGPKQWYKSAPLKAQEILDRLKTSDLPVPIGANITDSFMNNDGMVTLANSAGQQPQGGHAFLIVGARLIDAAKFPGEGGMCFIVKNSWGLGWGINGFSCMTLAWFNKFRQTEWFDLAFDLDLDTAYVISKTGLATPSGVASLTAAETLPIAAVTLPSTPTNPGLNDQASLDAGTPAPTVPVAAATPSPSPAAAAAAATAGTTPDGFTVVGMGSPNGSVTKGLYQVSPDGTQITIKGILSGETGTTTPLTFGYDGTNGQLTYTDPTKGAKVVGTLASNLLSLCSGTYTNVCLLNITQPGNTLVIGLTQGEWDNYAADPNASYTSLVAFAGYGIDAALAGGTFVDIRLQLSGTPTNPLRFKVDPVSGSITYKGRQIGDYQKAELCSGGDFRDICRFVVSSDDQSLHVFFKAAK